MLSKILRRWNKGAPAPASTEDGTRAGRTRSLVFIEQFYYPEGWGGSQVPRDITIHLARAGFEVCVVCGSDQYAPVEGDPGVNPAEHGVEILRLPRLMGGDIHSHKLARQFWFYLWAVPALLSRKQPDLYVAQTNPPLMVPLIATVASLRNVPLLIIAQDLYPEVMLAHGMVDPRTLAARALVRVFSLAYSRATAVVALGTTMAQRLVEKGVSAERIAIISNWATGAEDVVKGEANLLRKEWGLEGKFVVLYSGNVGIAHDLETPIRALARAIEACSRIRLVIVGKGQRLAGAKALVSELGLEKYVQFYGLVPSEMLPHSIGLADVALVTLRDAFAGFVVPSKLLGYMSRSIPTIFVGPPSDVVSMLADSGGGLWVRGGDVEKLAAEFVRLAEAPAQVEQLGAAAFQHYQQQLSREVALARYFEVVEGVLRRSKQVLAQPARP